MIRFCVARSGLPMTMTYAFAGSRPGSNLTGIVSLQFYCRAYPNIFRNRLFPNAGALQLWKMKYTCVLQTYGSHPCQPCSPPFFSISSIHLQEEEVSMQNHLLLLPSDHKVDFHLFLFHQRRRNYLFPDEGVNVPIHGSA